MATYSQGAGPGQRFLAELVGPWPTGCVEWPYSRNPRSRYGQTMLDRRKMSAHRASALRHLGPQPSPLHEVAHSCGNRGCVNPGHLRWATRVENHADKHAHGTMVCGEAHTNARLTAGKVMVARVLAQRMTHQAIADRFGVSRAAISLAIERKTWKHLPDSTDKDIDI